MSHRMDRGHASLRDSLRIVGPVVVGFGLVFTAIGIGSFFSAFGSSGPPRYFWCAFVGMPLIGIGGSICKFAYMGAVTRFIANETAPVGRDIVNLMADGTKGAVRDVAAAIGDGIRASMAAQETRVARCPKCETDNEAPANFCKACGTPLTKTKPCADCGEQNDPDARFCDHCGRSLQ